jgi:chemotaxis protein MotB
MDEHSQGKDTKAPAENSGDAGYFQANTTTSAFDCFALHGEQSIFQVRKPRQVHWAVAWSDIMMTMFILFAVLYIYQAAKRDFRYGGPEKVSSAPMLEKKTENVPGGKKPSPEALRELKLEMIKDIERPMESKRLQTMKDMERIKLMEDQAVRIVLPADLLFDVGRADLKPQAEQSLREIAAGIRETDQVINVVGHTDDVPIHSEQFATNWELSAIRACTVARFLIERMNIAPERFYVSGYSYFLPLKPNMDLKSRAENRRVEIILTKKKPDRTGP